MGEEQREGNDVASGFGKTRTGGGQAEVANRRSTGRGGKEAEGKTEKSAAV